MMEYKSMQTTVHLLEGILSLMLKVLSFFLLNSYL